MGRELRRKEAKRKGQSLKPQDHLASKNSSKKYLIVFLTTVASLILIYLAVAVFITKEIDLSGTKEETTVEEEASKVTNAILASQIFHQTDEEYYVYFFDFSDSDGNIASVINNSLSDSKVYRVNTSDALNKNYITEEAEGNRNVTSTSNLKVINPTLIKITGDTVTMYLNGKEEILNKYNN